MLIQRFCPGDNTLTAYGEISVCSRIGAPADVGYADSIYGKVNLDGSVSFDREKFDKLIGLNVYHYPKCSSCWAKWHCAGGCMVHKHTYNQAIRDEICLYMRNFCKKMLLRNLDKEYREYCGMSLKEAVGNL